MFQWYILLFKMNGWQRTAEMQFSIVLRNTIWRHWYRSMADSVCHDLPNFLCHYKPKFFQQKLKIFSSKQFFSGHLIQCYMCSFASTCFDSNAEHTKSTSMLPQHHGHDPVTVNLTDSEPEIYKTYWVFIIIQSVKGNLKAQIFYSWQAEFGPDK